MSRKSMSFMDRINGIMYVEEDDPKEPEDPASPSTPVLAGSGQVRRAVTSPAAKVVASAPASDDEAVEKFLGVLRGATADDRSEGHQKFWQQLTALDGVIPDEKMRYAAAIKTADGVSQSDLLSSIKAVVAEVGNEQADFESLVSGEESKEVGGARTQVQEIDIELGQLQKRLGELQGQRGSLATSISTAETKFKKMRSAFGEAVRRYLAELDQERQNINAHLGR